MRLINADALINHIVKKYGRTEIILDIDEAPTVEAEPVVRCKDCKFNYANQIPSDDDCQLCVELPISKEFFCAYGEKMDEIKE